MNLKAYREKLNSLLAEAQGILNTAAEQTRAMTEQENSEYNSKMADYDAMKRTYDELVKDRSMLTPKEPQNTDTAAEDMAAYIRSKGQTVTRAMTSTGSGAIIPTKIADMIVAKVHEISPLAGRVMTYYAKGNLVVPQIGFKDDAITLTYTADGDAVAEKDAQFNGVTLKNNVFACIVRISEKMIADTDFDVVGYVVTYVAEKIAVFTENALINGAKDSKGTTVSTGAVDAENASTTAAAGKITGDELIDLSLTIPQVYRKNAMWIVNSASMGIIRKLKDGNQNYLFAANNAQTNLPQILGIDAHVSENVPAGVAAILVDPSGMAWKISKSVETKLLTERYADYNQIGLRASIQMDTGIINQQKVAVLKYHE